MGGVIFGEKMKEILSRKESSFCSAGDYSWFFDKDLTQFLKESTKYVRGRLLDVGCGNKPYYNIVKPHCQTYISTDIARSHKFKVDVIAGARDLPFCNNYFDTVLSTQVFGHVPKPHKMVSEISRVLKHNGIFILTAAQSIRHNEVPYDYFRFTRYGLEYLLEDNSFKVLEIKTIGGTWALIGQSILGYFACAPNASYGIFEPYI